MKKFLSLLGLAILLAQPAFSQCGPGGCPVQQQSYQPMQQRQMMQQQAYQQPMQQQARMQPMQQGNRYYLQSYQAPRYVQQQRTGAACPVGSPCASGACPVNSPCPSCDCPSCASCTCPSCPCPSCAPQPCVPMAAQCPPNFYVCPNLMQGMTGAATNLQAPYCQQLCPQPKSGWRTFVEDYLGFDSR